jgi:hypothetical protein
MSEKREISYKDRASATKKFQISNFYTRYFEPELKRLIKKHDSLSSIKAEPEKGVTVEMSYYQNLVKRDVYKGLLSKLDEWIKNENKKGGN